MRQILENVSLKPYNTFGVEAVARFFITVSTEADLVEALAWQASQTNCPLLILGGGSNLLFTRDWPGLVIQLALMGRELLAEDETTVMVQFSAGESWHESVLWTVNQGWGGLENLSLIPGQVGTTPVQNIGAYGVEVKDTIVSVEAINISNRTKKVFKNNDCEFDYRNSVFKHSEKGNWVITSVVFQLQKNPVLKLDYGAIKNTLGAQNVENPSVQDVSNAVIAIRQSKLPDPLSIGNGGSFFKNPVVDRAALETIQKQYPEMPFYPLPASACKIPAGWLIDQAGWKGYRKNDVGVHEKQALVLVNYGTATGAAIWALAQEIQADIKDKFGIKLEPEINII